ncbi:MAG TPA: hypothetical protein DEF30_05200 [Proteiniclasticum sp.]|uniref:P-loop ATPase, Sll1717 family n=1 Tax=Proteiniclasticum sp. TaxID=2053595 RepID=UPI000E85F1C9|nr:hypothetical protein [Proteiniclasticum sp.]HBW13202.1 hypothetical protein [Proteiniclasticum sp.]
MKDIKIKDLYAGKPDAKDEIKFDGWDNFIKTFVVADHFNLHQLTHGTHCFVTGFKGTGKTALLFYLDNELKTIDQSTCSSFIFFKDDFTDARRNVLQEFSNQVLSSIVVEQGALIDATEFEYVWRWILFKQIVNDNETYGRNLFIDNEHWRKFEKTVEQIKTSSTNRKFSLANKVKLSMPYRDVTTMTEVSPELEVDLQNPNSKPYHDFVSIVDKAEEAFSHLTRSDIPYYIFIDELEAYYGDLDVFKRDLYIIRDLIFTVKRLNTNFASNNFDNTKIICSVRSEILTAISRYIVTKEINKVTSGFSVPLNWSYTNSNSHAHPIIQILLKRIAVCSEVYPNDSLNIYRQWFPEKIHGMEAASYILNNSWCKPRDMVRLITVAQSSLHNQTKTFSQILFDSTSKVYAEDSLQEIKEELRALYTSEEINDIITCFTGYRTTFSVNELSKKISQFYSGTVLELKFRQVIEDLYRLGFLGNFLPVSQTYRWQHKGDSSVILTDEWRLCVHYALHSALSIGARINKGLDKGRDVQIGDIIHATVYDVIDHFALVEFRMYGNTYNGNIHISEFGKLGHGYIKCLSDKVHSGDQYKAVLTEYDEKHSAWKLKIQPIEKEK